MSATEAQSESDQTRLERSRLVDHFKRAYQIVFGLSITIACTSFFPGSFISFPLDTSVWLFGAFFVTVIPIFQGSDRSLDVKYLHQRPKGIPGVAAYLWDVYMLLITAILFVKLAQSLPLPQGTAPTPLNPTPRLSPTNFYLWMGTLLVFDFAVLVIDSIKSRRLGIEPTKLSAYARWAVLNLGLGAACFLAVDPAAWIPALASWSASSIAFVVFLLALLRTILDYVTGAKFLFP